MGADTAYAANDTQVTVNEKTVTVEAGNTTVTNVYGNGGTTEQTVSEANGYTVNMIGGSVSKYVFGGCAKSVMESGTAGDVTANLNKVTISGGSVGADVYGGYAYSKGNASSGDVTANQNTVTISSGSVSASVFGGYANSVTDSGKAGAATANQNEVTISGGSVGWNVYGGYSGSGVSGGLSTDKSSAATASSNIVNISGGEVRGSVYGGYANSSSNGGTLGDAIASSNTVNISGGTIGTIYYSSAIYGGYVINGSTLTAENNVINLLTSEMTLNNAALYGYYFNSAGTTSHSGNTLNVCGKNITVKSVQNFESMNFFLPSDTASGEAMLNVTETANLTGTTLGTVAQAGLSLNKGDTVKLISAGTLTTDSTLSTTASVTVPTSITTDTTYTFDITKSGNDIIATVTSGTESGGGGGTSGGGSSSGGETSGGGSSSGGGTSGGGSSSGGGTSGGGSSSGGGTSGGGSSSGSSTLPERTKSLAETMAGSISFINSGVDMTVSQSYDNAAKAVAAEKAESAAGTQAGPAAVTGFAPFATIGGSNMRVKSGSYVDTKGWGIDVGFAREVENKQGKLLFGPMFGYGKGSYDSYLDNGVHGSGDTSFWSLGLMAKQMNHDGLYYEGSIRAGKVKNDYKSNNFSTNMTASYDSSATFYAAHLGVGKVFNLSRKNKLDTYLKYFYSHQGGDTVTVSSNVGAPQDINLDSVDSHRLRLGTRFIHSLNDRQDIYAGLAYQYEFKGDTRATYNGRSSPSPSIKGSSGMLELGFRTKASSNLDIDLNVNGWAGKQRGVNAQLGLNWKF